MVWWVDNPPIETTDFNVDCSPDLCVAGCDSKSQCDPGYGQSGFSEVEACPLNVCCSKFGFCGLTKEFCGDRVVSRPSCGDGSSGSLSRVVGYYEGWAVNRACQVYNPERIPKGVYTHINFAFAGINPVTFEIVPASTSDIAMYSRVVALKEQDPDLKVFIAIGGWSFNDPGPTATTFSDLVGSTANKAKFFASITSFLSTYGFDGVDIDWEYPAADDRSGRPSDFVNFPVFLSELRTVLRSTGGRSGLSITIPASYWYLQHFDIKKIATSIDWFNLMSYGLHGTWDRGPKVWQGAILNAHTNLTEIKDSLDLLWRNGISPSQVVMGLGFYARTFTLESTSCSAPGCKFVSEGNAGPCSSSIGTLTNGEITDIIKAKGLTPKLDEAAAVKILTWDDQWLTYDDADTFKLKTQYARSVCLGGVMVWAISQDSLDSASSIGLGTAAQRSFVATYDDGESVVGSPTKDITYKKRQCQWTNCGQPCLEGYDLMIRQDQYANYRGEPMTDDNHCDGLGHRSLCCPADFGKPDCHWVFFNGGGCNGNCALLSQRKGSPYTEVGSTHTGCRGSSYQAACCSVTNNDNIALYGQCNWAGYTPVCDAGSCGDVPGSSMLLSSVAGSGDVPCAWRGGSKPPFDDSDTKDNGVQQRRYCCAQPDSKKALNNCKWSYTIGDKPSNKKDNYCRSGCADGTIRVAMDYGTMSDGTNCEKNGGARVFCCEDNFEGTETVRDPALDDFETALNTFVNTNNGVCAAQVVFSKRDLPLSFAEDVTYGNTKEQGLEVRASTLDTSQSIVLKYIKMMLGNIQEQGTIGDFLAVVIGIWKTVVTPKYSELTYENIDSLYRNDPEMKRDMDENGYLNEATSNECKLAVLNARIAGRDYVECSGTLCAFYPELCNDPNDEDLPAANSRGTGLTKRTSSHAHLSVHKRHAHYLPHHIFGRDQSKHTRLEKRINQRKVTVYDLNGNPRGITIEQPGFISAGNWDKTNPIYDTAINFQDNSDCSNPAVSEYVMPDAYYYATEHLLEGQTLPYFIAEVSQLILPNGGRPTIPRVDLSDFFLNQFKKDIIIGASPLPGGQNPLQPFQRIYAAYGDEDNTFTFVLVREEINAVKGRLFSRNDPVALDKMIKFVDDLSNPFRGIIAIKTVIAVFNYMNHDNVHLKFAELCNLVPEQMRLSQVAYNALPTATAQINLVGLWDEWVVSEMLLISINARTWCQDWLDAIATKWQGKTDPIALQVLAHVLTLRGHLDEITINVDDLGA